MAFELQLLSVHDKLSSGVKINDVVSKTSFSSHWFLWLSNLG